VLVLALAGCGGEHGHGTATLWVTSDRGAHVLYAGKVPAGLTAIQALVARS
jgi:Zn-dependent alcohol dehydrogenase